MAILVGSTGFVGGHLSRAWRFDQAVHRSDLATIKGAGTELLVCAGLPAEKWRANRVPEEDWENMATLAQVLATVSARRAVLISTIDVYQPPVSVDEGDPPAFNGREAYGAHRAWFEALFKALYSQVLIVRLPGLFAPDVRKNLVHDLLHGRRDQWSAVNPNTTFQFFDVTQTKEHIDRALDLDLALLNVTSEPVKAQEIADLFGVTLKTESSPRHYDVRSRYAEQFGGANGYLISKDQVLQGISRLRHHGESR